MSDRNSLRVSFSWRKQPSMEDVTAAECCFSTPRIIMQRWRASIDEPRYLARSDHLAVRDVCHVHLAEERQHVVLAEAEHLDVFHDHHFVVADGEERALQQRFGVFVIAPGEELESFVNPLGCTKETFAHGIFAQANEHFADEIFESGGGEGR